METEPPPQMQYNSMFELETENSLFVTLFLSSDVRLVDSLWSQEVDVQLTLLEITTNRVKLE